MRDCFGQRDLRGVLLEAEIAQEIHGADGDGCWNPRVCYARRSHARHRDRRNAARKLKHQKAELLDIQVEVAEVVYGVLVVYRPGGADTPVHAITAEVWRGQHREALVPAVHCVGMAPSQVHGYVQQMLRVLEQQYGFKQFASLERREVFECPLRPCPHQVAGRV